MDRGIVAFRLDAEGEWVAVLDCGHRQHVRHRPPFQVRPWVLEEAARAARVGTPLDCPLCDRAELPEGLRLARRSPEWDGQTLPPGLRRAHRLAPGTWGRLVVTVGRLAFGARTNPPIERVLDAGAVQAIPPGVEHEVEPVGHTRLFLEFFDVVPCGAPLPPEDVAAREPAWELDLGGDPACWAHLFCPECGGELPDGHRPDCPVR